MRSNKRFCFFPLDQRSAPTPKRHRFPRALLGYGTLVGSLLLAACSTSEPNVLATDSVLGSSAGSTTPNTVVKSPNDDREYRYITLDNKLRVLLVADPETDKSAAALVALRGSFDEPEARPGLAHFLEHMLFIGTEKYPKLDGYQNFLARHGGSSNAYTSGDHTNYFFDVQPEAFDEALDRFAQFFIAPLLDPAYVGREKKAVHSEYQLQLKDDGWRGFAVQKKSMNPDHPGTRFNIGSLETLDGDVQSDLIKFFNENYSADQMTLVLLDRSTLDNQEALVREKFSAIKNYNIGKRAPLPPAIQKDLLPIEVRHQTLKDTQSLSYNFPVPSLSDHSATKPGVYISNLLGHEGPGSLYNHLRELGLVESLGASAQRFDNENSFISVDIQLTDAGESQVSVITEALFDYIELIKAEGINRWRYEEQAALANLAFRFREKGSATGLVYSLAPLMDQYPPNDLLTGPQLMRSFDEAVIKQYLNELNPDNVAITRASNDQVTDRVEEWFEVPYALETTTVKFHEASNPALKLPAPNPYIPKRLALVETTPNNPTLSISEAGLELWSAPDTEFGTPRSSVFLQISKPGGIRDEGDAARARLYARLVQDELNAGIYSAALAGLGYGISSSGSGFNLNVAGYSDKQQLLLGDVLKSFRNMEINQERFELLKTEMLTNWRNFKSERPYTQAWNALRVELNSQQFAPEALADALQKVTPEDLTLWRNKSLEKVGIRALLHGNLDNSTVQALKRSLKANLNLADVPATIPAIGEISGTRNQTVDVDHDDSATVLYVQGENETHSEQARFGLLSQLLRSPYFTALRTEQQLGYVVAAANGRMYKTPGLVFIVQSPVASSEQVRASTIEFVSDYQKTILEMSAEEFAAAKGGYLNELREKDKNQHGRAGRYWSDLLFDITTFDGRERVAKEVEQLTQEQMAQAVKMLGAKLESEYFQVSSPGKFKSDA